MTNKTVLIVEVSDDAIPYLGDHLSSYRCYDLTVYEVTEEGLTKLPQQEEL